MSSQKEVLGICEGWDNPHTRGYHDFPPCLNWRAVPPPEAQSRSCPYCANNVPLGKNANTAHFSAGQFVGWCRLLVNDADYERLYAASASPAVQPEPETLCPSCGTPSPCNQPCPKCHKDIVQPAPDDEPHLGPAIYQSIPRSDRGAHTVEQWHPAVDVQRCEATGNPVGTDIWDKGYECRCKGCLGYSRALTALSLEKEMAKKLAEVNEIVVKTFSAYAAALREENERSRQFAAQLESNLKFLNERIAAAERECDSLRKQLAEQEKEIGVSNLGALQAASAAQATMQGQNTWMKRALDAEKQLAEQRWIPVSKRLPEEGDWVLAAFMGNEVNIGVYSCGDWYSVMHDCKFTEKFAPVTHWQPLPAAPSSGEEEVG